MAKDIDAWPMAGYADFSFDQKYRYTLGRYFDPKRTEIASTAIWIMLNPSTATAEKGDPTIRRCITYSKAWDCLGLVVLNLFALRSPDPKELYRAADPVGPDNDIVIKGILQRQPKFVICAWGSHGGLNGRDQEVLKFIYESGTTPLCLRKNKDGTPAHPLYLPADLTPKPLML